MARSEEAYWRLWKDCEDWEAAPAVMTPEVAAPVAGTLAVQAEVAIIGS